MFSYSNNKTTQIFNINIFSFIFFITSLSATRKFYLISVFSFSIASWYCWKHGTTMNIWYFSRLFGKALLLPMQRLVWHSGQWYLVFLLRMRPLPSVVFQQKLQESAGPSRALTNIQNYFLKFNVRFCKQKEHTLVWD